MKPKIIQVTGITNTTETQTTLVGLDEKGHLYTLSGGNSQQMGPHWELFIANGKKRVGINFI